MAQESLADHILNDIAKQLGSLLPAAPGNWDFAAEDLGEAERIELAETFELWVLDLEAIRQKKGGLPQLARPTGRWHHQIRRGDTPALFARSAEIGTPAAWKVTEMFESELAAKIDRAISWIDGNVPGNPLARLLVVPAYQLNAMWLLEDKKSLVYVIDCPTRLHSLHPGDFFENETQFVTLLRKEEPVVGRAQADSQ
jgi:hypothetical protein